MRQKSALITGITGQDGSYLAELLLQKGYTVIGITSGKSDRNNVKKIEKQITWIVGDITDEKFVNETLKTHMPDEVYNLASISSVQSPWEDPVGTVASTALAPLYFLEVIRTCSPRTRFFQASSAEMYGDSKESPQKESTIFQPKSPYGAGKLLAHHMVENYRSAHALFTVSGILFNHESPRRPAHFVTRKITSTCARISSGANEVLVLGNLDAKRDWSFAGDIVLGMWLSLQSERPDSYIFASGEVHTVREFVEEAAHALGMQLHWEGKGVEEKGFDTQGKVIVEVSPDFYRPPEARVRCGDIARAGAALGWKPETSFNALVEMMATFDAKLQGLYTA